MHASPAPAPAASDAGEARHRAHCRDREEEFAQRLAFLRKAQAQSADDAGFHALLLQVTAAATQVHRTGYAVLPGLLDAERVALLRAALAPLFAQSAASFERLARAGPRDAFHVHNALAKTRALDALALHPTLRAAVGAVLGFDFLFHAGAIVTAHGPGCADQTLHRDDASFAALPRPRMPLVLTAAVALDDFQAANGATRLVPGSCWWVRGRRPLPAEALPIEMRAGSVLLWDGALFHGGGANRTAGGLRRTVLLNYTRGWLRTQCNQFLALPRALVLALPAELQKDLGYAPSLRGLGECDGRHPLDYLRTLQQRGDGTQPRLGPEANTDA